MTCPANPPPPAGYRVWRGAVPTPLTQWAMDIRDHIAKPAYGTTWQMDYGGQTVVARKDYHSWTYRGGQLVTGICIPGVTLYQPTVGMQLTAADALGPTDLAPDPTLAMWGADDVPEQTSWPLVIASGVAAAAVVTLFVVAIKHAGRARELRS
jgi:hypothetical protein